MRPLLRKRQTATKEDVMRRSLLTGGIVVAMVAAWSIGRLQGQAQGDKVIFIDSSKANYSPMKAGDISVSTTAVWGDANAGAHRTFSKFVPGYDAGMHTHTNDVWIVVVKGAYLYKDDAGEKRVSTGDFLRVPGGHKHWSGGDKKKEGAVFYEESSGKFDLIPAK
jgi:mannose-6-phosphate isomerase-like protein (cupin superfamily)